MDIEQVQQQLAVLRVTVDDRPFCLFVAVLLLLLGVARVWRSRLRMPAVPRLSPAILLRFAALMIAVYVVLMAWYVRKEAYYDFAEPTIAAVAWLFELGAPVYHAFDAPERYSHMYGPLAFIIPGAFLALTGPTLASSKAVGVLAALAGLAVIWRLVRSTTAASRDACLLTGAFAGLCLMYRNMAFWIRPDAFLLLVAGASLLASLARRRWIAIAATGCCVGVLLDLKVTGPFYALPAIALVAVRFGLVGAAGMAATGALVAALPFVLFDNVSLANYWLWVRTSAKNGLMFWLLRQNIEWALFMLLPLAPTLLVDPPAWLGRRGRAWFYGALALGLAVVAAAAAKPGAGTYHLMPFWPAVIYAIALHLGQLRAAFSTDRLFRAGRLAFGAAVLLIGLTQQVYFLAYTKRTDGVEGVAELTDLLRTHPGRSIAMGYAYEGERLTFLRPVLVFATGRYPLDAPAVQEYQMSGLPLPEATLDALRRCEVDLWLFPRGAQPFEGPNRYPMTGHVQLFPDDFKRTFAEHYVHTGDSRYFQIWSCRGRTVR